MTCFDDTYFEDHLYLLELSTFLEPKSQYSFDYIFQSINDEISKYEQWEEFFDGPKPIHKTIECALYHWYTQQWWNCALLFQPANLTRTNSWTCSTTTSTTTQLSTVETSSISIEK